MSSNQSNEITPEIADEKLSEALSTINNYITQVIRQMINARTKLVTTSEKILDLLINSLNTMPYTYNIRLGQVYDPFVRVEQSGVPHLDIQKPRMKLSYQGDKMTLNLPNGQSVEVPEVPQFVFSPKPISEIITEASIDYLRRNVYFKFPIDAPIDEDPDTTNAYNKFYISTYSASEITYYEYTTPVQNKAFIVEGGIFLCDKFIVESYDILGRTLHSNGEEFQVYLGVYKGKLYGTLQAPVGNYPDSTYDSVLLIFTVVNYTGKCSCLFFGKEIPKGPQSAENQWIKYVLWYQTRNVPIFVTLN